VSAPRAVPALALALSTALAARPATADPPGGEAPTAAFAADASGHRFRVGFDPASRIWLGLAGALDRGPPGTPDGAFEIDAGLAYRTTSARGEGADRVAWQIDHRILAGWVQPAPRAGALPALDATLYSVSMLRHDASPSLVLPTSPPVGIPFPFDVGVEAETGRVTTLPALAPPAGAPAVRIGVARAAILLDPWRSGAPGRSFEIGLGARYDLDVTTASAASATPPVLIHRIAPMTASSLRFRFQSRDGLSLVDCRGDVVPHYTSEGAWRLLALSSVHLERALVAVADQPIAAVLEGGYRLDPPQRDVAAASDLRVSLGLSVDLELR
jgi:hypothetical protein